jgi:hypothetical protein
MNQYFEIEMKVATLKHDLQIHPQNPTILAFHGHFPRCRVMPFFCNKSELLQSLGTCAQSLLQVMQKSASPKSGKDTMT